MWGGAQHEHGGGRSCLLLSAAKKVVRDHREPNVTLLNGERGFPQHPQPSQDANVPYQGVCSHTAQQPTRRSLASA
eukprot:1778928-Prymnesium_polylepis.1